MSDQSPSTKWCKKQDLRNQVVQFLTNPSKRKSTSGHSLVPEIGETPWVCLGAQCPPHMCGCGEMTKCTQTKPQGGGVLATERLSCQSNGYCQWFDRLHANLSDPSPSTKWCKKQECRNQVVQFLTNPSKRKSVTGQNLPPVICENHGCA